MELDGIEDSMIYFPNTPIPEGCDIGRKVMVQVVSKSRRDVTTCMTLHPSGIYINCNHVVATDMISLRDFH
jgi:hypothetical protein